MIEPCNSFCLYFLPDYGSSNISTKNLIPYRPLSIQIVITVIISKIAKAFSWPIILCNTHRFTEKRMMNFKSIIQTHTWSERLLLATFYFLFILYVSITEYCHLLFIGWIQGSMKQKDTKKFTTFEVHLRESKGTFYYFSFVILLILFRFIESDFLILLIIIIHIYEIW